VVAPQQQLKPEIGLFALAKLPPACALL